MLVISSREFRDNQKKYLDMVDNNQHIIIQRGKDKAYVLSPVSESDEYFMDPKVKEHVLKGIAQHKAGKTTKVDPQDFDKLLGL
ncbi:type II toxin-antitoxin system Phd/YefM family antitoxin [Echinicola soli]|uniref:Type II toxin-antitoxin system Phd/YefM family antitoxin n=1 Tax=Echinicola soli TaxID=2591634 RepID=A0A514CJ90_9BACT|nr:type II toxin-antitoxin system Phd/YefM family antitoxin [Echinicola soli]QDH79704.1 type II toxin-antitoxin system Phd/YefM family antitoxin [Echinicola soli]